MRLLSFVVVTLAAAAVCQSALAADAVTVIATGAWSKPVADTRGYALRGRLVLGEKPPRDGLREVVVYVELQEASEFIGDSLWLFCEMGPTDFRPESRNGLRCELRDSTERLLPATGFPFGGAVPKSEWVRLPVDGTIRLRATPFGIRRAGALAIAPHLNSTWIIAEDDPREYFLSGEFTIAPDENRKPPGAEHVWQGRLVLPALRIVNNSP